MEEKGTAKAAGAVKNNHKLSINMRKSVALTGVTDVVSFDDAEVLLDTELGMLTITGNELHVKGLNLEAGEMSVTGQINALKYGDEGARKPGESIWKHLWK